MANILTHKMREQPQSVILYGPSKTGKSTLAAQLAVAGYRLLWLDLENSKQAILTALEGQPDAAASSWPLRNS